MGGHEFEHGIIANLFQVVPLVYSDIDIDTFLIPGSARHLHADPSSLVPAVFPLIFLRHYHLSGRRVLLFLYIASCVVFLIPFHETWMSQSTEMYLGTRERVIGWVMYFLTVMSFVLVRMEEYGELSKERGKKRD